MCTSSAKQVASPPDRRSSYIAELEGATRNYVRGSFAVRALDEIDFRLAQGEFVALVGRSGCGKSTLLNIVSAVDRADRGRVVVCGQDLRSASEGKLTLLRRRHVGVVFQDFQLMPNLTAQENLALPLALDGKSDPDRIRHLLDRVGLSSRAGHYPSELSGGEQQRIAVARALVHRPKLIVADEPTGNLDSSTGVQILELLRELRQEEGAALLMATHDQEVAGTADRVVQMHDGKIASETTR